MKTMSVYDWFTYGEVGLSSEALMRFLFKLRDAAKPRIGADHPWDPADLARCRKALEATETTGRIGEAAALSPQWTALVAVWPDLCETMDRECPMWRNGRGVASETYEKMRKALYGVA